MSNRPAQVRVGMVLPRISKVLQGGRRDDDGDYLDDVDDHSVGETIMSGPDVSFEEHERLALAMLAVEAGNQAEVRDAMRKIVASAPGGTDVALLLSRALGHAEDRALLVAPLPLPQSRKGGNPQLRQRSTSGRTMNECRRDGGLPPRWPSLARTLCFGGRGTSRSRLASTGARSLGRPQCRCS